MTIASYNFDEIINRRGTDCAKHDMFGDDVVSMWVADMDFRSPEAIIEAIQARAAHGIFGYTFGVSGLKETIVQRMADLYNWEITPDDIVFIPGVVSAFNTAVRAYGQPGDNVLLQTPIYPPMLKAAGNNGQENTYAELTRVENGTQLHYEIDMDAFKAALNERTKTFLLCSPHNPTGRVWTRDELTGMAEACIANNTVIVSDEIHCDLVWEAHTPMAAISPEIAQHTVTLMAPSKTYNIPSMGFSFAIIQNAELRQQFQEAGAGLVPHVGVLGFVAAHAAYTEGDDWLAAVLRYMKDNRDFTTQYIAEHMPSIKATHPEGTYLTWMDVRDFYEAPAPDDPMAQWIDPFFLREAKVALNAGGNFGEAGKGYVRLNFATPRANLVTALDRMREVINRT